MSKPASSVASRVRAWLKKNLYYDALFMMREASRAGWQQLRELMDPLRQAWRKDAVPKKPRPYRLTGERLEDRQMMTTVQFSSSAFSLLESGGPASITVMLDAPSAGTITVDYATSNGTATAGSDFTATSGALTFAPNETVQTFAVPILDDSYHEGNETLPLMLTNPSGASLGSLPSATLTILDDDDPPTVQFRYEWAQWANSVLDFSSQYSSSSWSAAQALGPPDTTGYGDYSSAWAPSPINGTEEFLTLGFAVPVQASGLILRETYGNGFITEIELLDTDDDYHTVWSSIDPSTPGHPFDFSIDFAQTSYFVKGVRISVDTDHDLDAWEEIDAVLLRSPMMAYALSESAGFLTAIVSLSVPSDQTISVDYTTADGTAEASSDYVATSGTLTFQPGETVKALLLSISNDSTEEDDETFDLTLSDPVHATLGSLATITATIENDDDSSPTAQFSSGTYSLSENGGSASIIVTLSTPSANTVTVNYATSNGTATVDSDYTGTSGTLTFAPNETIQTFEVPITNDSLNESSETIQITLSSPVGATLGSLPSAALTILDEDDAPTVQFGESSFSVNEDAGTATVIVNLSAPSGVTITVEYATSDGTAIADSDYTGNSGTLTFAPGETSKTFNVSITDDELYEGNETITLSLSNPTNTTIFVSPSNPATVVDESPYYGGMPWTNPQNVKASDGNYATNMATTATNTNYLKATGFGFNIPSEATIEGIVVEWQGYTDDVGEFLVYLDNAALVMAGTVGSLEHWAAWPSSLTYVAFGGSSDLWSNTLTAADINDSGFGAAASFYGGNGGTIYVDHVRITVYYDGISVTSTALLTAPSGQATLTILDDEDAPTAQFSASTYSLSENDGSASITVTLSSVSANTVTVNYATSNGTATAGSDYDDSTTTGTLTFAPNNTVMSFNVPILDDSLVESSETIWLTLSSPSGTTLGSVASATLTILDDDTARTAEFSSSPYSVAENGGPASITVTLSTASANTVTVNYATSNGTATAGSDYDDSTTTGTLTFAPNNTVMSFNVPILDDSLVESSETIWLTLSSPSGTTLGSVASATLTILDDDTARTAEFSSSPYSVAENGGPASITVTLSTASANTVTVNYATSNGTAIADSDYDGRTGTVTFAPNITVMSFNVPITDDSLTESSETLQLALTGSVGASVGTWASATLTILDDDTARTAEFSSSPYSVAENGGPASITVTLSTASANTVTVNYATSNGTATAGSDYDDSTTTGTLTFAPNNTVMSFNVPILDDSLVESSETIWLTLSSPSGTTLGSVASATLTILDDDTARTAEFSSSPYSVAENGGPASITVTLSTASANTVTVNYATSNGTATAGSDYDDSTTTGTLTFAPNNTVMSFNVPILDDSLVESSETIWLTLSSPSGTTLGSVASATLTILDDDTARTAEFSSSPYSVAENGGPASITVTLSTASANTVTVNYATSNGTATAGSDYDGRTGTLTFAPHETVQYFAVPITDDSLDEDDETLQVTLSSPVGATVGSLSSAILTILNDDDPPDVQFSTSSYSVAEWASSKTITVTLSAASGKVVTVEYSTDEDTATEDDDYTAISGTLTFNPGEVSKTFVVAVVNDADPEDDETVHLTLSNAVHANLAGPSSATLTILDDDSPVTVQFSSTTFSVGESDETKTITVTLSAPFYDTVTVHYATSDGTAETGSDYTATSGTLTFAPHETVQYFAVPITDDSLDEDDETLQVTLSSPVGATVGSLSSAILTILNDDDPPDVQFSTSSYSVAEWASSKTITVTLSAASGKVVTVEYSTDEDTATEDDDYTAISGTLTFNPGEVSKTFVVAVVNDADPEDDETVHLTLSNAVHANLAGPSSATLTILDDDSPVTVQFSSTTFSVGESDETKTITVTLSAPFYDTVTVHYATSNGTAETGSDYTTTSGTLTFDPHETSKTFFVSITPDTLDEFDETVMLTLSSPSNATLGTAASATLTIEDDDDPPSVSFSAAGYSVGEDAGAKSITVELSDPSAKTVTIHYATADGTATGEVDYTSKSGTLTFAPGETTKTFSVPITDDQAPEDDETVQLTLSSPVNASLGAYDNVDLTITNVTPTDYLPQDVGLALDRSKAETIKVGEYVVNLRTGNLNVNVAASDVWMPWEQDSIYYYAGLVYNSDTAAPRPMLAGRIDTKSSDPLPTEIRAHLTWDGAPQDWVSFAIPDGSTPGDSFYFTLQTDSPVALTDLYDFTIDVKLVYAERGPITRSISDSAVVVANGAAPYGHGWSLPDENYLLEDAYGNIYLIYGDGGYSKFEEDGDVYTSPAYEDLFLTYSSGTYTFTSLDGMRWHYHTTIGDWFLLDSVVDANGNTVNYTYDGNGLLTSVRDPNNTGVVFTYSSGQLTSIQRGYYGGLSFDTFNVYATTTVTYDAGDLTTIADSKGGLRTFTYTDHKLSTDTEGSRLASFTYTNGAVTEANLGSGLEVVCVKPQLLQAIGSTAATTNQFVSRTTRSGNSTDAMLDALGRLIERMLPDGTKESWTLNAAGLPLTYKDGLENITTYTYDSASRLATVTDPAGGVTTYLYASDFPTPTTIIDPAGRITTYVLDAAGNILHAIDPSNNRTTYTWSGGLLQSITDSSSLITTFVYDSYRQLQTVLDPNGQRTTYQVDFATGATTVLTPTGELTSSVYDTQGRRTADIDAVGNRTSYTYTDAGQRESTIDPAGNITTFVYDTAGRQIAAIDPLGNRTSTIYDASGRVEATIDQYGHATTFLYDVNGRQTGTIDPLGNRTTTAYDLAGQVIASTDQFGNTTTFFYDAAGRQTGMIDPLGNQTTTVYDTAGNILNTIDEYGHVTTNIYDAGNLTSTTDWLNHTTTYTYTAHGRLATTVDQYGYTTTNLYDDNDRLSGTIDAFGNRTTITYTATNKIESQSDIYGAVTTFHYDASDRLESTEDRYGHFTTTVYDDAGRVEATIDVYGNRTTTVFDDDGRTIATIDYLGNRTSTVYDGQGRVSEQIDALGNRTTTLYDAAGRVETIIDMLGQRTTSVYDAYSRLIATVDPYGNRASTVYDDFGMVEATIDRDGNATTFVYDTYGRQIGTIDPFGNRATTVYDSFGRVQATIDMYGHATTTVYDDFNRVIATIDIYGHAATTVYDSHNHVIATIDTLGNATTFVYDTDGHQVATIDIYGNRSTTVYDGFNRVSEQIDGLGNRTTFLYDSRGREEATIDALSYRTSIVYDSVGRVSAQINALGNATTFVYDSLGRLQTTLDAFGHRATVYYDDFGRTESSTDLLGNRTTTVWDTHGREVAAIDHNGHATTTVYDSLNRQVATIDVYGFATTAVYDSYGRQEATIDSLGNRTSVVFDTHGNVSAQIDPFGNRTTFLYDSTGRQVATEDPFGKFTTTVYDTHGRVEATIDVFGNRSTIVFDSLGREQASIDYLGNRTTSVYDGFGRVEATIDALNQRTTMVFDSHGRAEATIDQLGNRTTAVFDDFGRQAASIDRLGNRTTTLYDPLGRPEATIDPLDNRVTNVYDALGRVQATIDPLGNRTTTVYDGLGRVYVTIDPLNHRVTTVYYDSANRTSITFQVEDDGGGDDIDPSPNTGTIIVSGGNDAPAGTNNQITTNEDTAYVFDADDFGFTDPGDSPANLFNRVKITTLPALGSLTLNGAAVNAGDYVTKTQLDDDLLVFTPVAQANGASYASFTFQVEDDSNEYNLDLSPNSMVIDVAAVNDAPANTVPGSQSTVANTAKVFSGGSLISVADIDAGSSTIQVTLSVSHGALTLSGVSGLSFSFSDANGAGEGDGTWDGTLVFRGTASSINAALNGLSYLPSPNYVGSDTLSITVNDLGNAGTGGALTDTDTVGITVSSAFFDNFDRANSANLGGDWTTQGGSWSISSNQALSSVTYSHATVNGVSLTDVVVQADMALPAGDASTGLLARYSASSMYWGDIIRSAGTMYAQIYRYSSGVWTSLTSVVISSSSSSGTLRFEVVNDSLKLFLDGVLVTSTFDSVIPGAGSVGLFATAGNSVNDFTYEAHHPLVTNALPFSDSFTLANGTQLSPAWREANGNFSVASNAMVSSDATNLAIVYGVNEADVSVEADVALASGAPQYAGVVARYAGPAVANMYWGGLYRHGSTVYAEIYRNVGGTWTALSSQAVGAGTGTVRFEVIGNSLQLYVDGALVTDAFDSTFTAAGSVGLWGSQGNTFDSFSATVHTPLPDSFADAFTQANSSPLSTDWRVRDGSFAVQSNQPLSGGATNLATVNSILQTDTIVQADVTLNVSGDPYAGVVARYTGDAVANMYWGGLYRHSGTPYAEIYRNVGGTWTLLSSQAVGASSGTVRFEVIGNWLQLYFNGTLVTDVLDSSLTAAGSAGIWGSVGNSFDNFRADRYAPVFASFADSFTQANSSPLSTDWRVRDGGFSVQSNQSLSSGATNLATVDTILQIDSVVQADVTLNVSGDPYAGVVARYNGAPGVANMYWGGLYRHSGTTNAEIYRNIGGVWTLLSAQAVGASSGTVRFEVIGNSLQLYVNGTLATSVVDSTLAGAGSVGIWGSVGNTFDNFRADSNDAPVNTVPGSQSTDESTTLVFSTANGNAISIADSDAGSLDVQVTLTATHGMLTLSGTSGLTFTVGDGSADADMTFTGSLTDINAALAGLTFAPTSLYHGSASIQIDTSDLGHSGPGGPLTDTDTVAITVNSVNAPPLGADQTLTIAEAGTHVFTLEDFGFSDPNDTPPDNFLRVKINTLPSVGLLTLDGVPVHAGDFVTVADILANKLVYRHEGRQETVIDELGNRTITVLDSQDHVIATIDTLGNRMTTIYDSFDRVSAQIDAAGNRTTYLYDAHGRQETMIDALGNRTTAVYDGFGRVSAQIDQLNHATTFQYDAMGRQESTLDAFGNRATSVYDAFGRVEANVDVYGNRTTTVFDSYGRQQATIDQFGHSTTTVYDSLGRQQATIDAFGHATTIVYDAYGRQEAIIDTLGNRATTVYDGFGRVSAQVDQLGNRTTFVYDGLGRQEATINALGNRVSTVYDAFGRVSAQIDSLGNRMTTTYDALGRQESTIDALNHRATTVYDAYGRVSSEIDKLGNRTTMVYDDYGRQIATIDAAGNRMTTVYDAYGRQQATIDGLGNRTTSVYDALGRVQATIDALGHATTITFDALGREQGTIDYLGNRTTVTYDGLNRVASTIDRFGHATTYIYDSMGRQTGTLDYLNNRTTVVFDAYGRQIATIDELGNRTTTVLDDLGREVNLIDASGNTTTFVYDALNREIQRIDPTNHSVTQAYDAIGQLSSTTDAIGRRRDFSYDAIGRKIGEVWVASGGSTANRITYTYDAASRVLTASDFDGTYTMTYDAAGHVATANDVWNNLLTFTYDSRGNRTKVEDSQGGVTTSVYDADNRLISEQFGGVGQTPLRVDYTYDAKGQLLYLTRYSNLAGTALVARTQYTYNVEQQITNLVHKDSGGTTISSQTFTYDAQHRLLSQNTDGDLVTYSYDALSQVTGDGNTTLAYDATGNRTTVTVGGNTANYSTTAGNQLQSDGTWDYLYDAAGNMTYKANIANGDIWTYGYDNWNHLTDADHYDSGMTLLLEAQYKYDVFGNRIEKSVDSDGAGAGAAVVTRMAYDQWNPAKANGIGTSNADVWGDFTSGGSLTTRYLYGDAIDDLLARLDAGTPRWYLKDQLGSIRNIIDNSGVVKDSIEYDAFGNILTETDANERGRYAWTSREIDVETQLQYNRARYYDATTGRWISQDPLGFDAGDSNLYRYVMNRPTIATDPSGQELLANSDSAAEAMRAWLAGENGELARKWGKVPTPIQLDYVQAPSGRFLFTYKPADQGLIQRARDEANRLVATNVNTAANTFRSQALSAFLSTNTHREVSRVENVFSRDFSIRNVDLRWSEMKTSVRHWTGAPLPYDMGDEYKRLVGSLIDVGTGHLTMSVSEHADFLKGVAQGFVMDGLVDDVKMLATLAQGAFRYATPFGIVHTMYNDWRQSNNPLKTYAGDYNTAVDGLAMAIQLQGEVFNAAFQTARVAVDAFNAINNGNSARLMEIAKTQSVKALKVFEVVAASALDLAQSGVPWLKSPLNRGRIAGLIAWEIASDATVEFFTAGAGSAVIVRSAKRLAKVMGNVADATDVIVRMMRTVGHALGYADDAADVARRAQRAARNAERAAAEAAEQARHLPHGPNPHVPGTPNGPTPPTPPVLPPTPPPSVLPPGATGCFVAGTSVWVEVPQFAVISVESEFGVDFDDTDSTRTIPIEEVLLGQRVPSHRSEYVNRDDTDYSDWKEIRLVVSHRNGSVVDVQLLRSEAWIEANGIRVGETIDLRMTELEVNADALVVAIVDGPEVLPGEGPVVTGRFVTRQASDLVRVTFAGGVQLVGTHSHPIWSPLHQDWRALGEFEPGDLVQARTGLIAVQAVEPLAIRPAVYNIEVAGEHVYEVTELGVLVHNNNPLCDQYLTLRNKVGRTHAEDLELARLERILQALTIEDYRRLVARGDLTSLGFHDIYVQKVRPGATEVVFPGPGGEIGQRLGSRRVDDIDRTTGTIFEFNSHQWGGSSDTEVARKLNELAADAALLGDNRFDIRRVQWYGLEDLPTTGPAARLREAFEAYRRQGLAIEYTRLVPPGW